MLTAANVTDISSTSTAALSSGSTTDALTAVRQLTTVAQQTSAPGASDEVAAAVAAQTAAALTSLATLVDPAAGTSADDALSIASTVAALASTAPLDTTTADNALQVLHSEAGVHAAPVCAPALIMLDWGVCVPPSPSSPTQIAASVADSLRADGGTVAPSLLAPLVDIANTAADAAAAALDTATTPGRRLLAADLTAEQLAAAASALTRVANVVAASQALALAGLAPGEASGAMGSSGLLAAAASVPTSQADDESYALGSAGAAFLPGFAALCAVQSGACERRLIAGCACLHAAHAHSPCPPRAPTLLAATCPATLSAYMTYAADPSLLLAVFAESSATLPGSASRRRTLLADAPMVSGALSTTIVSGECRVGGQPHMTPVNEHSAQPLFAPALPLAPTPMAHTTLQATSTSPPASPWGTWVPMRSPSPCR